MIQIIFILGNPIVVKDSLPLTFLPRLKKEFPKIAFVHLDPTEEFTIEKGGTLCIIDSVEGIKNVTQFQGLSDFEKSPRFSVHDYDLLLDLSLQKKLGKIRNFIIIGIPQKGNLKKIQEAVISCVSTLLSKNEKHSSYKDHTT